ncbi:hypothetical protein ANN_08098, partial [Periplaneta americana]
LSSSQPLSPSPQSLSSSQPLSSSTQPLSSSQPVYIVSTSQHRLSHCHGTNHYIIISTAVIIVSTAIIIVSTIVTIVSTIVPSSQPLSSSSQPVYIVSIDQHRYNYCYRHHRHVRCIHRTAMSLHESENWGLILEASSLSQLKYQYFYQSSLMTRDRNLSHYSSKLSEYGVCAMSEMTRRRVVARGSVRFKRDCTRIKDEWGFCWPGKPRGEWTCEVVSLSLPAPPLPPRPDIYPLLSPFVLRRKTPYFGGSLKLVSLQRRISDMGRDSGSHQYRREENEQLRTQFHFLLALAFVPKEDILEAFDLLIENVNDLLSVILNYVGDNYIRGHRCGKGHQQSVFPPNIWNCYQCTLHNLSRTTNTWEAWHRRINTLRGKPRPSFFHVQQLRNEVAVIDRDIERLQSGFSSTKKKRKYVNTDARISRIVERYENYNNSDDILAVRAPIGFTSFAKAFPEIWKVLREFDHVEIRVAIEGWMEHRFGEGVDPDIVLRPAHQVPIQWSTHPLTKEDTSEVLCVECGIVETWTLRRSEEKRLEAFEMWIWRRMDRVKWTDKIRNEAVLERIRLRWAGHVALMGESINAYRVLVGRPEGKRPLGRPRRRWEDNIKMDLREVGYDDRDWINLAQDRDQWRAYVRAAMNLRVP